MNEVNSQKELVIEREQCIKSQQEFIETFTRICRETKVLETTIEEKKGQVVDLEEKERKEVELRQSLEEKRGALCTHIELES